ncbi:MAG: TonB family protein [Acidobacteriota bacterium]|nr:TonB family protein [Acidobacteriota bacterium]
MPLNVRRFCTSVLLIFTVSILISAQTSGDVMRERVAKAKAFIAIRNYNAAIYELENIRRETSDPTVNGVINVLLINSFLEQGDYKRAQDFLTELSKSKKQGAAANYFAAAGQVVKGTRNQMERYRALGLSVADRNLPKDAVSDVDKMRQTLEIVVEQTKVLSKDKTQTSNAMALMEEATNARSSLARDDFDANRWKNEVADARENLANSRSVVVNAVVDAPTQPPPTNNVAANTPPSNNVVANLPQPNPNTTQTPILQPVLVSTEKTNVAKTDATEKPIVTDTASEEIKKTNEAATAALENSDKPTTPAKTLRVENSEKETAVNQKENKTETPTVAAQTVAPNNDVPKNDSPLAVGSLIGYATEKANPVYPLTARNMRMTGIVKVDLVIDETGKVAEVQNTSGPPMLQRAATDAVKKWKFKPFTRGGLATKATGFVNFNFSL